MRKFYNIDPKLSIDKIEDVLNEPIVVRVTLFNEESLEKFEKDLDKAHNTGQDVIPIIIDSYGGEVYSVLGFLAAIESCRLPVATVLTSKAMSCGAILFCFGTEGYRYMHEDATLMIHDASSIAYGKVEEIKANSLHLDQINSKMYEKISKHLGHKKTYLSNLIKENRHADWYINAEEAVKHNMANHIKMPKFDIELKLRVTFS